MTNRVYALSLIVLLPAICLTTIASAQTSWWRTYGGTRDNVGYSVQQTTDGGYIVAGYTYTFGAGNGDFYLIKTNAQGDTLWTRTYGGPSIDEGSSVEQTTDGGYIMTGETGSFGSGNMDVHLVKTNAQGDTLWTRTLGSGYNDAGLSVQQTTDSGYVIAGVTSTYTGKQSAYLIKTNFRGDTLWTRTYGGIFSSGCSVQQIADGGYVVAGSNEPDSTTPGGAYLVKTDARVDTARTRTYGLTIAAWGNSVQQTSDGGYIVTGGANGLEIRDVYLLKTDSMGNVGIEEPLKQHPAKPTSFLVQPNPFTSFARVPGHETDIFVLSDVAGRQVAICKGDRIGVALRPGIYFLSPVGSKTGKAVTATVIKAAF